MQAQQLSYHDMTVDPSGQIMSQEAKEKLRKQYGYCLTCPGVPVLLYDIQKSRMNPLWSSKKARAVEGISFEGKCVQCNPRIRIQGSTSGSVMSTSTHSNGSQHRSNPSNSVESNSIGLVSNARQRNTENRGCSLNGSRGTTAPSVDGYSVSSQSMTSSVANSVTASIPNSVAFGAARLLPRDSLLFQATGSSQGSLTLDVSMHEESREIETATPTGTHTSEHSRAPPIRQLSEDSLVLKSDHSRGSVQLSHSLQGIDEPQAKSSRRGGRRVNRVTTLTDCAGPAEINLISSSRRSVGDMTDLQREDSFAASFHDSPFALETTPNVEKNKDNGETVVEELQVLVAAMKGEENLGILTEILISSMDLHKSLESVQAFVLEVMSGAFRDTLTDSDVLVSKILRAMKDFGPSLAVQKAGCRVIHALATHASNGGILVRTGACSALSSALSRHIGDTDLVVIAVAALRMLSVSKDARKLLEQNHVASQVAQAMHCNPYFAPLQLDGCALLSNIVVNEETRTVANVEDEAIQAVVGALIVHKGEPAVTASACFALKNFAFEDSNLKSLVKVRDVFDIVQGAALTGGGDDALFVLEKLHCLTSVEAQSLEDQTIESIPVFDSVVDVVNLMKMNCRSPKVILEGMKALIDLMKKSTIHREALQDGEVLANLLQFPELYHDDEQIQEQACALMDILADEQECTMNTTTTYTVPNEEPLCVNAHS